MPEIQLNGKTIATQTGTNEPVLKNNVVMESGFSIPSGVIDNALSNATFPSGHVLQVKQFLRPDTTYTISSQSYTTIGLTDSIELKQPNSTILVMANIHTYIASHTDDGWSAANYAVYRDNAIVSSSSPSAATGYSLGVNTTSDTDRSMDNFYYTVLIPNPSTPAGTTIEFDIRVASRNGYNVTINNDYGYSRLFLMELAV